MQAAIEANSQVISGVDGYFKIHQRLEQGSETLEEKPWPILLGHNSKDIPEELSNVAILLPASYTNFNNFQKSSKNYCSAQRGQYCTPKSTRINQTLIMKHSFIVHVCLFSWKCLVILVRWIFIWLIDMKGNPLSQNFIRFVREKNYVSDFLNNIDAVILQKAFIVYSIHDSLDCKIFSIS